MVGRYTVPVTSSAGSSLRELFIPFFDEDGHLCIKDSGVFDVQEQIDANSDFCDINALVSRYEAGDISALNRRQGMFGDFTSAPDSYRQALEIVQNFNSVFNDLGADQRAGARNALEFLDTLNKPDVSSVPDSISDNSIESGVNNES